ncbi:MAG: hypothetical protein US64_C0015G0012, partial [Candidatus Nomurabacteria bacterium GW2011_GWC1_37_9]
MPNRNMEQKLEKRICQNCRLQFTIEPDDFSFYEKIKVPAPTFCPECRMQRRFTFRNERVLHRNKCAKTGKSVISCFSSESPFIIYDRDIWWSDKWDPTEYGMDYDFSLPFFEQYNELLAKVPLANLGNTNCVNSPYGNHNADCKNCYLVYASYLSEDVMYSQGAANLKNSMDTYTVMKSENCYQDTLGNILYNVHFSYNCDESINSFFIKNCLNCIDCIGCMNLRNKKYCIFNQQYTKEEYEEIKKDLDFGSYKKILEFRDKFKNFVLMYPNRYGNIGRSVNISGAIPLHLRIKTPEVAKIACSLYRNCGPFPRAKFPEARHPPLERLYL